MPRAKHVELSALMLKADKLHANLSRVTAEYNKVIAQAQLLQKVQQKLQAGDFVYIGDDYCQVLLKTTTDVCKLRVLRKCDEPALAFVDFVHDYQVTQLDEVIQDETE